MVITIPTPNGTGTSAPTGTVFNATTTFLVGPGAKAIFLFVTEDGTIAGWNPGVNPNAVIVKNRAGKAIYKGCAIGLTSSGPRFYATNFQATGWKSSTEASIGCSQMMRMRSAFPDW